MSVRVNIERARAWRERLWSWPWRPWMRWQPIFLFDQPFTLEANKSQYQITIPRQPSLDTITIVAE